MVESVVSAEREAPIGERPRMVRLYDSPEDELRWLMLRGLRVAMRSAWNELEALFERREGAYRFMPEDQAPPEGEFLVGPGTLLVRKESMEDREEAKQPAILSVRRDPLRAGGDPRQPRSGVLQWVWWTLPEKKATAERMLGALPDETLTTLLVLFATPYYRVLLQEVFEARVFLRQPNQLVAVRRNAMNADELMRYLRAPTALDSACLDTEMEAQHPAACRIVKQCAARLLREREPFLTIDLANVGSREDARDLLVVCAIPRLAQTLAVTHRIHLVFLPPGQLLVAPLITGTEVLQRLYAMPPAVRAELIARVRST